MHAVPRRHPQGSGAGRPRHRHHRLQGRGGGGRAAAGIMARSPLGSAQLCPSTESLPRAHRCAAGLDLAAVGPRQVVLCGRAGGEGREQRARVNQLQRLARHAAPPRRSSRQGVPQQQRARPAPHCPLGWGPPAGIPCPEAQSWGRRSAGWQGTCCRVSRAAVGGAALGRHAHEPPASGPKRRAPGSALTVKVLCVPYLSWRVALLEPAAGRQRWASPRCQQASMRCPCWGEQQAACHQDCTQQEQRGHIPASPRSLHSSPAQHWPELTHEAPTSPLSVDPGLAAHSSG